MRLLWPLIAEKYFLYLRLSWPAGHSKRAFTNKAQTVRCIGINSFEEKVIDKSHKKRYILSINAMRKSARCFCRSESRSPAANPVRPCGVLSLLSRSGELKSKPLSELSHVTGASRGAGCSAQFGWYRGYYSRPMERSVGRLFSSHFIIFLLGGPYERTCKTV